MHVPGQLNIADLGTRGFAGYEDVGGLSEWQNGSTFLQEEESNWPVSNKVAGEIPKEERVKPAKKLNLTLLLPNNSAIRTTSVNSTRRDMPTDGIRVNAGR